MEMIIKINYKHTEPLKEILMSYDEFVYTFVFEGEYYGAETTIVSPPPLAFQIANILIREIQINEGIYPTFSIMYDGLVYNSLDGDLGDVKRMLISYIKQYNDHIVFDDLDVKSLPVELIKYLGDDFDMGFVSSWDGGETEFNFVGYDGANNSIEIHVSNPPPTIENKINLTIDSEDILFDDILSIAKAILIKNIL